MHLMPVALPSFLGINVYLKESSHPTGSLKHRLVLWALPQARHPGAWRHAERSLFIAHVVGGVATPTLTQSSRVEGIGRPHVEATFVPGLLAAMVKVPDLYSLAARPALSVQLGRRVGGLTGIHLMA